MIGRTFGGQRGVFIVTIVLAVLILIPSLIGFASKLVEFYHVVKGKADGAFALTPIVNYVLASLGFLCLLVWAAGHGMFHDLEAPKHAMLAQERRLDEEGTETFSQPQSSHNR